MSAFTSLFRTHEGNQPDLNYQVYSNSTTREHFARFSNVYAALADYREDLFAEAETLGWPVVRHLGMHYPDDAQSWEVSDQFLLGSEVLVAPIKNKCWTWPWCPYDKTLYLPPGEWVHLWSGEIHGDGDGEEITVQAPLGEPAVFYRKGSAMAPGFVQSLRDRGIDAADAI